MLKKIITLTLITSLLSACVTGPDGYLKRSANNKIFDRHGFKGGKRAPLYNKRYITQAKKNILNDNIEDIDDEDDNDYESQNSSQENIEMYKAMINEDLEREKKKKNKSTWWWNRKKKQTYPSAVEASRNIDPAMNARNLELREELDQIKAMLRDKKRDMASYKCPTAQEQEKKSSNIRNQNLPRPTLDRSIPRGLEQKTKEIITNDHVHSI